MKGSSRQQVRFGSHRRLSAEPLESRRCLSQWGDLTAIVDSSSTAAESLAAEQVAAPTVASTATTTIAIDQAWLDVRGSGPYALAQAATTYRLDVDVATAGTAFYIANRNITLDLNGHTIRYGESGAADSRGVVLYLSWHNTEISIPGAADPLDAVIRNGSIVNAGNGARTPGIYGYRANGVIVEGVEITTRGADSATIWFNYSGAGTIPGATLRDNVLTTYTNQTANRHAGPANVWAANSRIIAERNTLLGGNSGFNVGSGSFISRNLISHDSFATNGYGVWLYRNSNVRIEDNLILPTNGRGILFNAGSGHTASGNVILHLEAPNAEFGSSLNPPAVRARYNTSDIVYAQNISLGVGGGALTSASSLYLTTDGTGVSRFEGNDATVILTGTPSISKYAQPLTLEGTGDKTTGTPGVDLIVNNRFRSNHLQVRVEGYDGFAQQQEALSGNRFEWADGATAYDDFAAAMGSKLTYLQLGSGALAAAYARVAQIDELIRGLISAEPLQPNRAVWHAKYASHNGLTYVDAIDSSWGPGVDPMSLTHQGSLLNQGAVRIREGFTRDVLILRDGAPAAYATLQVQSDRGDAYDIVTDASGIGKLTFFRFSIEKAEASGAPFVTLVRAESTLTDGVHTATIRHDAVPAQINLGTSTSVGPSISLSNFSASEGNLVSKGKNAGQATVQDFAFVASLSKAADYAVSVDFATQDGLATVANGDYQPASGTLTFLPGETAKTIVIKVMGDGVEEPDEDFSVILSNPQRGVLQNAVGAGVILNDDGGSTGKEPGRGGGKPKKTADASGAMLTTAAASEFEAGTDEQINLAALSESSQSTEVQSLDDAFALDAAFASWETFGSAPVGAADRVGGGSAEVPSAKSQLVIATSLNALSEVLQFQRRGSALQDEPSRVSESSSTSVPKLVGQAAAQLKSKLDTTFAASSRCALR